MNNFFHKLKSVIFPILIFVSVITIAILFAPRPLSIKVYPIKANVMIDNQALTTSTTIWLYPKTYQLSITAEGYVPYSAEIKIGRALKYSLSIQLKPIPSPVKITENVQNIFQNQSEIFVLKNNTLFKLENEVLKQATPAVFKNVKKIIWNPTANIAIVKIIQNKKLLQNTPFYQKDIPDETEMTFLYDFKRYDLRNQETYFWDKDIKDAVWSVDGEYVFYVLEKPNGEKSLIKASKNNQNRKRILDLQAVGIENPFLATSPDGENLLIIPRYTPEYEKNKINLLEILTGRMTILRAEGHNIKASFSPDGKKLLFSHYQKGEGERVDLLNLLGKETELGLKNLISFPLWLGEDEIFIAQEGGKLFKLNIAQNQKTEYIFRKEGLNISKVLIKGETAFILDNEQNLYKVKLVENRY